MSCDSMESQFSCAAQPDLRSGQSPRRPPPRRGPTRSAAASPLLLPLACEERRGASDHGGRRSRAQLHRLRRKRRIFRWGALCRDGPPGLGGGVYQLPLYTHPDPWDTRFDPVDHHMSGNSCACEQWNCASQWWNPCVDFFVNSGGCRAREREGMMWRTERHESETVCGKQLAFHASQWCNPCDDEGPYSFRGGVCFETSMPTPVLTSPPTPAPPTPTSTPAPTLIPTATLAPTSAPSQSNMIAEGDPHAASLTGEKFAHGNTGEMLTFHASQWWNPCDEEGPYSSRCGVCYETPMPTLVLTSPPTPASTPAPTLIPTPTLAPTSAPTQSNTLRRLTSTCVTVTKLISHFPLSTLERSRRCPRSGI